MCNTYCLAFVRNAFWVMTQIQSCLVKKAVRLDVFCTLKVKNWKYTLLFYNS